MLNVTQVLGTIDRSIESALDQVKAVDREVAALTERLVQLRQEQSEVYQELARLRLNDIASGDLVQGLSAAERQARSLLDQRREAVRAVDDGLANLESELAQLREQRDLLAEKVEQETLALEKAERAVLESLAETEEYRVQLAKTEKAEAVARQAEQKTAFAEEDRAEKGKPYEDDPLFVYLWERGWGTSRYSGGSLSRYFDGKVADLIDYDKARPNYAMLLEIPKRLAEHAERQRSLAEEQAGYLAKMEEQALGQSDAGAGAEQLANSEGELDRIEEQIEETQKRRNDVVSERAQLTSGKDEQTKKALQVVLAAIQRQDLQSLRRQAARTPSPEDDTVVAHFQDIEEEIEEAQALLKEREAMREERRRRLEELEQVRRDQRRSGNGRDIFDFRDPSMLDVLLAEVLAGALSRDAFRDQINRRRKRRLPGSLGGGIPRLPRRRGGFGGGGFRTGGMFSGKTFRTGGQF